MTGWPWSRYAHSKPRVPRRGRPSKSRLARSAPSEMSSGTKSAKRYAAVRMELPCQAKKTKGDRWGMAVVLCLLFFLAGCAVTQTSPERLETIQDWMKLESPRP